MWNGDINNIDEVATYLNNELNKGRTQKEIEINDFKVNERVIAKRLTKRGYKKVDNQYIKYDNSNTVVIQKSSLPDNIGEPLNNKVVEPKIKQYDNSNIVVNKGNKREYDNSNTLVINQKEIQNKLIGLAQNYDKILRVIQEYDKKYDNQYDGITVELPIETKADFRATIRLNNVIWEQFSEFVNNHKEFTKRDLISMALKEYMENHK